MLIRRMGQTETTSPARQMGEPSDETLLAEHLAGDPNAFSKLVTRYQRELFVFLAHFTGDRTLADDIFQESFVQVHQSLGQFDLTRKFRPWLFTIAANKARDAMRANARRQTAPLQASISSGDDESGEFIDLMQANVAMPGERIERVEIQQRVRKIVMQMPDNLREVLMLAYFEQFPYKQISDMLNVPLGTVKSRLHSAVALFAEKWKSANPDKRQA